MSTVINNIKKEFDYLHEVLASDRETYIWAIDYVKNNIIEILENGSYQLGRQDKSILQRRMRYLEHRVETKTGSDDSIGMYVEELSALRKVFLREEKIKELQDELA